jgi:hypothetical protein
MRKNKFRYFNLFIFSGTVLCKKGKSIIQPQKYTLMKNTALITLALFFGAVANAQTGTPTQPASDTTAVAMVDTSVGKAYVSHPDKLKGLTAETLTPAHIFPAVGSFKGSGTSTADVTITLDEENKGIVWIEGLPQGRFKALMKKAPSTYKIPAQKSESGKAIAEGTLYVNPETNELTIVLGRSFTEQNTGSSSTASSKKKTGWQYTGVKADVAAAATTPVSPQ